MIRRALDIWAAALMLVLTAPIQVLVAALVAHDLGHPVLFRQTRTGLRERPFTLVKFRTMRATTSTDDMTRDAERLTPLGARLRSWSLDELPTLWNVLRGDLSLVGPRPLLPQYLSLYTPEQRRRHTIRPGVTGLAQVRGRNALPWADRLALDVWYVDHTSLTLDLQILADTVVLVLSRRGVTEPGRATMTPLTAAVARMAVGTGPTRSRSTPTHTESS